MATTISPPPDGRAHVAPDGSTPALADLLRHHGDQVYDRRGDRIGWIDAVFVDDVDDPQPRWLAVATGSVFGAPVALAPVDGARMLEGEELHVAHDRGLVASAPDVGRQGRLDEHDVRRLCEHYGLPIDGARACQVIEAVDVTDPTDPTT